MTNEHSTTPEADIQEELDLRSIVESTFGPGAFDLIADEDEQPTLSEPELLQTGEATTNTDSASASSDGVAVIDSPAEPVKLASSTRIVLFELAECLFALPVTNVCEIRREPQVTRLPHVPEWVRGVTNLRGSILSVVDLRLRMSFDQPKDRKRRRMIVVRSSAGDVTTALLVDRVLGIHALPTQSELAHESEKGTATRFIREWRQFDTQAVAILDLEETIDLSQPT